MSTPTVVRTPFVPPGERIGVIRVIGTGQRFVLVQTPTALAGVAFPDGQALLCHGEGTTTLRVSRERRPPFIVADVVAGEPRVGDEVFLDSQTHRNAPPASLTPTPSPAAAYPPGSPSPTLFHADPPPTL